MNSTTELNRSGQDSREPEHEFDYTAEAKVFKDLITRHAEGEERKCLLRREARRNRINIQAMKQPGPDGEKQILEDETVIPDRTIEFNIAMEKPPFIAFVEQPQTVLSFSDPAHKDLNYEPLAVWVTDLFRYQNWKTPWLKLIDSILLHGAGAMECVFSPKMPGKFVFEYIKREDLIYPDKTTSLAACARFCRRYELTKQKFKEFTKRFGFDPKISQDILDFYKEKEEFIRIFKYFIRAPDDTMVIAWMAPEEVNATNYLKAPQPHFLGDFQLKDPGMMEKIKSVVTGAPPVPIPVMQPTTTCPIVLFPYNLEDDEVVKEIQGRAALDIHVQSAIQANVTATTNAATRASKLYPYIKPNPLTADNTDKPVSLKHGMVNSFDLGFLEIPWPNNVALSIAQMLSVRNQSQLGSVDYAAMSRQDTAKRATEITAAQQQADQLKSTKISLFGQSSLELFLIGWNIIKNQIKIGAIQIPQTIPPALIDSPSLTLVLSADAQVVRKAQLDAKYLQYYALTAGTKLQEPYFRTMMQRLFPEEFPVWQQQGAFITAQEQVLGAVSQFLMSLPAEAVPPQLRQIHLQLLDQIQAVIEPAPENNDPASKVAAGNVAG